jgi:aldose 1-epimerase
VSDQSVTLRSPGGQVSSTFLPVSGMICRSLTHDGEELLAQRGGLAAYEARGSTFAIPILYPWANRLSGWEYSFAGRHVELDPDSPISHKDEHGMPSHGVLAAARDWILTDVTDHTLEARLDFGADPLRAAAFPFPHTLVYSAAVSDTGLAIALEVEAGSDGPVPIAFGFHPYLTLPGSPRESWTVTLPVGDGGLDGPLDHRDFDDGFDELLGDPPIFAVEDERRRVSVTFADGYRVAQVYSPEGSDFIAFEPMTAPVDALRSGTGLGSVAAGESFTAVFTIQIADLVDSPDRRAPTVPA